MHRCDTLCETATEFAREWADCVTQGPTDKAFQTINQLCDIAIQVVDG